MNFCPDLVCQGWKAGACDTAPGGQIPHVGQEAHIFCGRGKGLRRRNTRGRDHDHTLTRPCSEHTHPGVSKRPGVGVGGQAGLCQGLPPPRPHPAPGPALLPLFLPWWVLPNLYEGKRGSLTPGVTL